MKQRYLCMKNWTIESGTYFEKGEYYDGISYHDGKSVKMYGAVGMIIHFHQGSDYFNI